MIRILDNNALIYLSNRGLVVTRELRCYLPSEIHAEFSGGVNNDRWLRQCQFLPLQIDQTAYLREYASIINRYSDISFYSMKGLEDLAILATASVLLKGNGPIASLFPEQVCVVSGDAELRDFASAEFTQGFSLETPEEFATSLS